MGNVQFGIPESLVIRAAATYELDVAVETGTYMGESALVLAEVFDEVHTIEYDEPLALMAAQRIRAGKRIGSEVTVHAGSTAAVLPGILGQLEGPALFWLDAHWFPRMQVTADPQCPLLEEIRAISRWRYADSSCLLIDDAHLFSEPLPEPSYRRSEWPSLDSVVASVTDLGLKLRGIAEDVLVFTPRNLTLKVVG